MAPPIAWDLESPSGLDTLLPVMVEDVMNTVEVQSALTVPPRASARDVTLLSVIAVAMMFIVAKIQCRMPQALPLREEALLPVTKEDLRVKVPPLKMWMAPDPAVASLEVEVEVQFMMLEETMVTSECAPPSAKIMSPPSAKIAPAIASVPTEPAAIERSDEHRLMEEAMKFRRLQCIMIAPPPPYSELVTLLSLMEEDLKFSVECLAKTAPPRPSSQPSLSCCPAPLRRWTSRKVTAEEEAEKTRERP